MKNVLIGFLLFAAFVGAVGGFGYLMYYGEYHIAIGLVATAYLACFKGRELWKVIWNE
jgi:hypothetical protein